MFDATDLSIWDLIGFLFLIVAGYAVVTRLIMPQFALPWIGKGRRKRAVERIDHLLSDSELDTEERSRLERHRNTLLAYDAPHREQWSGKLPIGEIVDEVDTLWESRIN